MKGCDNCYYESFDEKAYPCSLCIRGIKRTDKWMPSKKTKDEIQTETSTNSEKVQLTVEPQTKNLFTDKDGDVWEWRGDAWYCISGDEPQTERSNNE